MKLDKNGSTVANVDNITTLGSSVLSVSPASILSMSELQSNPIYVTALLRICSTRVNHNKEAVDREFIYDIVENKKDYIGMPLYADTRRLMAGEYGRLGHLQDPKTGKFYTTQIGTFVDFEVLEDEYGTSLIGEARISKRDREIAESIVEMYDLDKLRVSFEVFYTHFLKEPNDVTRIVKHEKNKLVSVCVVSVPAYTESKALALVAEKRDSDTSETSAAEVSLETVSDWVNRYVGVSPLGGLVKIERIGTDFAILYEYDSGKTFKLEFNIFNDGFEAVDIYEVELVRKIIKENEADMKLQEDTMIAEVEAVTPEVEAEVVEPTVEETKPLTAEDEAVVTAEAEAVEAEPITEAAEEAPAEKTEDEQEKVIDVVTELVKEEQEADTVLSKVADLLNELELLLANLGETVQEKAEEDVAPETEQVEEAEEVEVATAETEEVVKVDAPDKGDQMAKNLQEAEQRMKENRERMTQLASARGFDTTREDVSAAIEALDYQKLMECENSVVTAANTLNGMTEDMKLGETAKRYHPSLEKVSK